MKVVFRGNLGTVDARALEIDGETCAQCRLGQTVDLKSSIAEELIRRGVAVSENDAKSDPLIRSAQGIPDAPSDSATVKAVAKPAAITAPGK